MRPAAPPILLWTDGAYGHNGTRRGGWAFVAVTEGHVLFEAASPKYRTTANRMELTAAIEALVWAKANHPGRRLEIHSDSRYVVGGATRHLFHWALNDWRYRPGQFAAAGINAPVGNADLWKRLDRVLGTDVRPGFFYVPGHSGIEFNEHADVLSKKASRQGTTIRRPAPRRI